MLSKRKGICAVVFHRKGKTIQVLLLHRVLHWKGWEFPKGGCRKGETQLQTLKRELCEELGVSEFLQIKKSPVKLEFFDSARNKKVEMQAFLVELPASAKISILKNKCKEHSSFKWVSKLQALKLLSFENQKKVFRKALRFV
jgi:8-oxo-dGTP pyrophosphatase MutT (NUDIX family)